MNRFAGQTPITLRQLGNDLLIGLTLAVVVLPQAIAFSTTLAGVPPHFGIYAAIWGALFTALLNPSKVFHGGPNSGMAALIGVVLLPVAPQFGATYMGYALTLVLLAGLIQLLFVLIGPLRRLLDFISEPVINGMICGIGLFLIFKSIPGFSGLPINTEVEWPLWITWQTFNAALEVGNLYAIRVAMTTLVVILLVRQLPRFKNWAILCGIVAGTCYSEYLSSRYGLENTLIEQTASLSHLGAVFPSVPLFSNEAIPDIIRILPGAVSLALLGLFQTVTAMRRMNRKKGIFVDSSQGVYADGVSNCLLPFLSALPTCASFNRMWLMHSMGAVTRLAAISSAFILLGLVLFFSDLIAIIPIPAMAAVIMVVGANMINWQEIKPHFNNLPEGIVFGASFASVHIFGLFGAVLVGALLALAHLKWVNAHPWLSLRDTMLVIKGNIYYGSLPVIESLYHQALTEHGSVVVDIRAVGYIDPEGLRWLTAVNMHKTVSLLDRRGGGEPRTSKRTGDRRQRDIL
ncbi:MAG: SulP family sulfate permease [Motiliproteus sp.]|jgi:SulP family sulfate permease